MTDELFPVPGPRDVHRWRLDLDRTGRGDEESRGVLSADEVDRASRFHRVTDRARYVAGRFALRSVLGRYLGVEAASIRFAYGPNGKPTLDSAAGATLLEFNLSHSGPVGLCAFTWGRTVGVDVEEVRDEWDPRSMMEAAFDPTERAEVRRSETPSLTFSRIWVRKEAVLKAIGIGFGSAGGGLSAPAEDWNLMDLTVPEGYVGAVAVRGDAVVSSMTFP